MKTLILANDPATFQSLIASLSSEGEQISVCSYKDLAFSIDGEIAQIVIYPSNTKLSEFSKIIVLSTSPLHAQNYIFSALACYCRKNNITILDDNFTNTDGKLYALWRFWENNIPVAKTFFGPTDYLAQKLADLGGQGILKSVQGTKGKDNYLIQSEKELRELLKNNVDTTFILQNFIQNDGDWRIIVINFEPKLAIYRSSHGKDHRNNTSVGGDAKLVPLEEVDPQVLDLAVAASKSLNIKIAGADIIKDNRTGELSVLEVNRTPQLATGAFVDEKAEILKSLIRS